MDKKILEQIFASGVLTEETKKAITEALTAVTADARASAIKEARKEVGVEFKKNKAKVYETVEKYIENRLDAPIKELHEEAEQIRTLKGQYADRIVAVEEAAKTEFDLRWKALVETLTGVVEREIGELHESEKTNRRAFLKAMNEMETRAGTEREQFKKKAALVLENILDIRVQKHLDEHESDLRAAMKSDFGTEIFEAFYSTMQRHFFSTNKEAVKLAEGLKAAKVEVKKVTEQARARVEQAEKRARIAESSRSKVVESHNRVAQMAKLLAPLKGAARDKMKSLLEASPTAEQMIKTYKRFLPEVVAGGSTGTVKPAAVPNEIRTGGATQAAPVVEAQGAENDTDLVDLRRRSGMTTR